MKRLWQWTLAVAASTFLAACGGGGSGGDPLFGGGPGGGGGGGATGATLALVLSSTTVTGATPVTVSATVRDASGAALAGTVVSFTTTGGLGSFSSTTALTDASGLAVVTLSPATSATNGADQVVASASVAGTSISGTAGFALSATNVTIASFVADLGGAPLAAYGQTNLTVTLGSAAPGVPVNVTVASSCVTAGLAVLTPTTVSTTTGVASFTYRDNGCGAVNTVDPLQVTLVGTAATANLNIALTSPGISSLSFVSASPSTIFLRGSGFVENSDVTFQVRDTAGNGLPGRSITLSATTLTGGLTLDGGSVPVTRISDADGNIVVRINSGTVPTPVAVRATVTGTSITTVSSSLAIAVGLPSQLNFSLSQNTINIEGDDIDGTTNSYGVIASDRLGNPVPNGTAINFVTEAGQVQSIAFTTISGGLSRATASFQTSEPRPADGRVTVLAYSIGEESFLDTNGNNVIDSGELFQDLGDAYLDRTFEGTFDAGVDQFFSLAGTSGACTPSSGLLAIGLSIPSRPSTCDGAWGSAFVRRAIETVFSTSTARPLWFERPDDDPGLRLIGGVGPGDTVSLVGDTSSTAPVDDYTLVGRGTLVSTAATGVISFLAADANPIRLNPMAAGTTVSVSTTTGITASVAGGSPVPNTSLASFVTLNYSFETASSGVITVTFTSPSSLSTSVSIPIRLP